MSNYYQVNGKNYTIDELLNHVVNLENKIKSMINLCVNCQEFEQQENDDFCSRCASNDYFRNFSFTESETN